MNICRTCLKFPADKRISELKNDFNMDSKNDVHIMVFCLDIKVEEDSKMTTNLCENCFREILSFYKFKTLALKNDAYLKSLGTVEQSADQQLSVYEDVNGIKYEYFLDSDESNELGPNVIEDCNTEVKIEVDVKDERDEILQDVKMDAKNGNILENVELDEAPLCVLQKCENIVELTKETAPKRKKCGRPKKGKPPKKGKGEPELAKQMCEECGKTFINLKKHLLQHRPKTERRKIQCKGCPKLFLNAGDMSKHYKITHLGLRKQCPICNKEVTRLAVHMARHNPSTMRFPCVTCARRFVSQAVLDAHLVSHTNNYAYECDICKKKFRSKGFVTKHIRQVHEKERNQKCEMCPKAFFDSNALKEHIKTHSNERRFECNECGLAFKTKVTLRNHVGTHNDIKRFHCEQCGKSFKMPAYLNFHMVTHTKEKRFECRYCGVRFGRAHHRSRHELTAHQNKEPTD